MRARTANRLLNNLYLSTFLVAFASVALGSLLPCPAHTLESETPEERRKKLQRESWEPPREPRGPRNPAEPHEGSATGSC
ncbi:Coa2p KNAG_0M00390 [Huiozyma naganishii CBS 8797]|uniref:Uncharacterized protein n=1 Tax=Huiozyma naganishii (strain ATCC MYA-139 / BCRC 22969 / CBS 8797 / KCTC 17520 / NBRC 10181 / NCYC 3082 / Yp74L-3) TaxID=1071383 RepID=J7S3Y1_HUIN7|nr:hypothetical protein KNAG_0M00390 [Kazachstania naganishii CBS 8797]CCK72892.1 hypothetical protein KNAG_0M00390 [Kazachstania naganishii CBS 8797]